MKGKVLSSFAILLAFAVILTPLYASASSVDGTGQNREISLVFNAGDGYVNATVTIPEYFRNDTNQSFVVSFVSDSASYQNMTVNVTINGTAYTTGTVMVEPNGTEVGYINITADALDLGDDFNLTVVLDEFGGTTEDVYYGEVDLVDSSTYARLSMAETLTNVVVIFIFIGVVAYFLKTMKKTTEKKK